MRFGINTFLFTSPFTTASTRLFSKFKRWGFDSVEIAIEDPSHIDACLVRERLDQTGLSCGAVTACLDPSMDLRGSLPQQRAGITRLKRVIDMMQPLGAPTLSGVFYSTVGRAGAVPRPEYRRQWKTVVGNLRIVAEYAAERGRILALEPINRFETDFINTCAQGLEMIHDVGSPALNLHLDTFHMNIEEKNPSEAIRMAGSKLAHFHACGADRGTPGNDAQDWDAIATALKEISYQREVVIESFTCDVKSIARAAAIWRKIEPSRSEIASKGVIFLRKLLGH